MSITRGPKWQAPILIRSPLVLRLPSPQAEYTLCLLLWRLPNTHGPFGHPFRNCSDSPVSFINPTGWSHWTTPSFRTHPPLAHLCDFSHAISPAWHFFPSPLHPMHPSRWQIKCHLFHEVLLNSPKGNESFSSLLSRSNVLVSNVNGRSAVRFFFF